MLIDSQPLQPPETSTTVRVTRGRPLHSDGPYAETKEWLGGYFLLDCHDQETAVSGPTGARPPGTAPSK